MRKKAVFVVLTWIMAAFIVLILYLLRDISPVKEFIAWALSVWQVLALIGVCAIAISGWVIKHNFGKKFEIDIHKSKATSSSSYRDDKYIFDIDFVLKTPSPPVDIAWVRLHLQGIELQSTEVAFKLDNTIQSHSSTFESLQGVKPSRALRPEDRYYLSIFALGKEWQSKEFQLDRSNIVIIPGTLHVTVPPDILAKIKKSITDNKDS